MDFTMTRGDSFVLALEVAQSGAPSNLAGATIWMTAKFKVTDDDTRAAFQVKTPSEIVITDEAGGLATITVPPAATADLSLPTSGLLELIYDVQVKLGTGIVSTVAQGKISVAADVTRATSLGGFHGLAQG